MSGFGGGGGSSRWTNTAAPAAASAEYGDETTDEEPIAAWPDAAGRSGSTGVASSGDSDGPGGVNSSEGVNVDAGE